MHGAGGYPARLSGSFARAAHVAIAAWLGFFVALPCLAGEESRPATVDYLRDIKPLLSKRCYACHGVLKRTSGLRLDTAAFLRKGGDGGPAIVPGKSEESLIVEAISGREGWRMPPEGDGSPFSDQEIATVRAWIDQGARRSRRRASPGRPAEALGVPSSGAARRSPALGFPGRLGPHTHRRFSGTAT